MATQLPNTITVPYQELYDGLSETIDMTSVKATKKYIVAWNDRWQFARDVAGRAQSIGTAAGSITRNIPLQYPDNKNLYANGLEMVPVGSVYCTQPGQYDKAIVTISFATASWDFNQSQGSQDTVYRTIEFDLTAQQMTLPTSPFQFATGANVKTALNPGILMPTAEVSITSHYVPYLPLNLIFPLVGTINATTYYGASPGQLLFGGVKAARKATSEGIQAWEVTYKFIFRQIHWNKFYSPVPGVGWDFLVDSSTGSGVYASNEFAQLP